MEDLAAFIRSLNLGRVHLVGNSYAASRVGVFALEHPELLRSAVLGDSSPVAPATAEGKAAVQAIRQDMAKAAAAAQAGDDQQAAILVWDAVNKPNTIDQGPPALQQRWLGNAKTVLPMVTGGRWQGLCRASNLGPCACACPCPCPRWRWAASCPVTATARATKRCCAACRPARQACGSRTRITGAGPGLDGALRAGLAACAVLPGPRTGLLALQHGAGGGAGPSGPDRRGCGRARRVAAAMWQRQCGSGAPKAHLDHGDTVPGPEFDRMRDGLRLAGLAGLADG